MDFDHQRKETEGFENPFFKRRNICPICHSNKLCTLYKRSYFDSRMLNYLQISYYGYIDMECLKGQCFEISECEECGFLFQPNILNDEGSNMLYDKWIDPVLADKWRSESKTDYAFLCSILLYVERCFGIHGVNILDYGAGFGNFAMLAKGFGFDVSVLEFSESRAASLRACGLIAMKPGEEAGRTYHFIYVNHVLEHLSDPVCVLQKIRNVLCDNGLAYVAVPNCTGLKSKLRIADSLTIEKFKHALLDCSALQHINCFTPATLQRIAQKAGFRIMGKPFLVSNCTNKKPVISNMIKLILRAIYYYSGISARRGTGLFLSKL